MNSTAGVARGRSLSVDTDGGALHVQVHGAGPPVVLVHGWTLDHRSFAPQVASLAGRFTVIVFDRRGFGQSSAPPDLNREPADIERILEALGIDSVHLVGVSQGGRIALRFAVTRPVRVRSLVLQGAMVDGVDVADTGDESIPLDEYTGLARAGDLDELRRRWLAHPLVATRSAAARTLLATIVGDYQARDLVTDDAKVLRFCTDPLAALADFDQPVLLVTGAGETAARKEHARRVRESATQASEIVMPHSGHLANLEESEAFNAAVAHFFEQAEQRRPR